MTFGLRARRDPLRAGERDHAARARPRDRRGGASSVCSTRRRSRRRSSSRRRPSARSSTWRRSGRSSRANRESLNVEAQLPPPRHRLLRVRRHDRRRNRRLDDRLRPGRPDRLARRRRLDAARRLAAPAEDDPDPARGGPRGHRAGRDRAQRSGRTRGVTGLHDLHVWEIGSDFPALSAHVLVARDEDCHRVRRELERADPRPVRNRAHDPPGRAHLRPAALDQALAADPEGPLESDACGADDGARRGNEASRLLRGVVGPFFVSGRERRE